MSLVTIILLVAVVLSLFRVLYLEDRVEFWKNEAARQEMYKKETQVEKRILELQVGTIKSMIEQI